ncbi:MAG: LCP family protein [Clostridiales bacterium]|nr:LCP family protein [Clostridiales bacterium]
MEGNRRKRTRYKKRKSKKKLIIFSTLLVLLLVVISVGVYGFNMLGKLNRTKISDTDEDLGISSDIKQKIGSHKNLDEIVNIALFGLDQRDVKANGRSDSIMVLSLDKARKKIKLFSIMRDSYVHIDGRGEDKITHAYYFGGPQLAIKTINENFGLNIRDFVTVNFFGLEKIIDALGGVEIDVKPNEVEITNSYINEVAKIEGKTPNHLSKSGKQNLTGMQAVAYSRNRYTGNGDYERTERQRRVLNALINKIMAMGATKYPGVVSELLPYVNTSLTNSEIISLGLDVFKIGNLTIDQERFPVDGYCKGQYIKEIWYLVFDKEATKEQVFDYLYNDKKPTAK